MLAIIIFKWLFIFSAVALSIYYYILERRKLSKLSHYISDPKIISELRSSARMRMGHFFILFSAFIVWIMSYDLQIENVNKERTRLAEELQKTSKIYKNLDDNQKRLVEAQTVKQNVIEDVRAYYTDVFVNYYVMRKCNLNEPDDIFIINSALTRELSLNHIPLNLRDEIIKDAQAAYLDKYSEVKCKQVKEQYFEIITNYRDYIKAIREVLKAIF